MGQPSKNKHHGEPMPEHVILIASGEVTWLKKITCNWLHAALPRIHVSPLLPRGLGIIRVGFRLVPASRRWRSVTHGLCIIDLVSYMITRKRDSLCNRPAEVLECNLSVLQSSGWRWRPRSVRRRFPSRCIYSRVPCTSGRVGPMAVREMLMPPT